MGRHKSINEELRKERKTSRDRRVEYAQQLREQGLTLQQIAVRMHVPLGTVYVYCRGVGSSKKAKATYNAFPKHLLDEWDMVRNNLIGGIFTHDDGVSMSKEFREKFAKEWDATIAWIKKRGAA